MFNEPGLFHALLLVLVVSALYALRKRLPGTQFGRGRDKFESPDARRRRRQLIALECTELALAGVFFLVGGAKLIGRHDMVELFRSIGVGQWLRYVTGVFEVVGAAFMVVPLASGASAVALGTVMISATLIELFVLRRPPIAAMACLSAHTYVAWSRLLHRAGSEQVLAPPTIEAVPADPQTIEPMPADLPTMEPTPADPKAMEPLLYDHAALHVGMNVAGVCERAGAGEGSRDRRIRVDARDIRGCPGGGVEENVVPH
jgi:putative oxidoreductase